MGSAATISDWLLYFPIWFLYQLVSVELKENLTQTRISSEGSYWLRQLGRFTLRDGLIPGEKSAIRMPLSILLFLGLLGGSEPHILHIPGSRVLRFTGQHWHASPRIYSLPLALSGSCAYLCTKPCDSGANALAHPLATDPDQCGRSMPLDVLRVEKNNFSKTKLGWHH